MSALASEVTRRYEPVTTELLLHAEVPLRDHCILRVVIDSGHDCVERPGRVPVPVFSKRGWERFAAGIGCPRIVEVHTIDDLALAGRRRIAEPDLEER